MTTMIESFPVLPDPTARPPNGEFDRLVASLMKRGVPHTARNINTRLRRGKGIVTTTHAVRDAMQRLAGRGIVERRVKSSGATWKRFEYELVGGGA